MSKTKQLSIRLAVLDGKKAEQSFLRVGRSGQEALGKIEKASKPASLGLKAVDSSARALNSVLKQAAGLVAAYAGIGGIIRSLHSTSRTGMAFEGLNTALETITGSSKNAAAEMAFLEQQSERLGLNLLDTAQSYMQIAAAAKGTKLAGQATRDIFTAVAEASTVLQLSSDQTSGALRAISQIMSKGKVQAEELRGQLGERLYGAFQLAARGMGLSTQELDKMLEQGKLIADDFLPKFAAEIRKTFADGVPAAAKTARAEMNRFNNAVLAIERTIAASGFLDGITQGFRSLTATLSDPAIQESARSIGETLGSAVVAAADSLGFSVSHAGAAVTAISSLIIARTVAGGINMLTASIAGNAGMVVGLKMASSVSAGFAMRLVAVDAASKLAAVSMGALKSAMMLVGGPVGVAVLAGAAILKLASGHNAAEKAARDHGEELQAIRKELTSTAEAAKTAGEALSKTESIYRYTKQLKTAKENIAELKEELKYGQIGGFWDQFKRFGKPLQADLRAIRNSFAEGKITAKQYSESLFKLATKYPDFGEQAEEVQEQVFALLAAERAAVNAKKALDELRNPKKQQTQAASKPKQPAADTTAPLSDADKKKIAERIAELTAEEQALKRLNIARGEGTAAIREAMLANQQQQALRRLGLDEQTEEQKAYTQQVKALVASIFTLNEAEKTYQENQRETNRLNKERQKIIEEVRSKYNALDTSLAAAINRANSCRQASLQALDATKAGYNEFAAQVEAVYRDMIAKARDDDLQNSKRWQDGITRGLKSVIDEADDMAAQTERLIVNAFGGMEDALVNFTTKGKADFKSLADSVVADIIRMQVRSNITSPLAGALNTFIGGMFGETTQTATAHSGGVIGTDTLKTKAISPHVFASAPKFHGGGIVGDEVPIIAKRGESVFTPGQMQALGGELNKPVKVEVNVHNTAPNVQATAQSSQLSDGSLRLDIIVEQIEGQMKRNVTRGEGLAPTLERRYGLNPAAGSYR